MAGEIIKQLVDHGVKVSVDPTGKFEEVPDTRLLAATGFIPYFIQEVVWENSQTANGAMHVMGEAYGFGVHLMKGTVTAEGVYQYPGDPDLPPLVVFRLPTDIQIIVYQHAIVAVRDGNNTLITRMD